MKISSVNQTATQIRPGDRKGGTPCQKPAREEVDFFSFAKYHVNSKQAETNPFVNINTIRLPLGKGPMFLQTESFSRSTPTCGGEDLLKMEEEKELKFKGWIDVGVR